ncbi:ankyrin repeat-containing domain protein [Chaetomium sp. MPI-CAGE-AT-0009]|nr:ankyrin repeat-containing domain protein [Chaetomium sp. MPI-CAGE-AT-0009]
MAARWANERVVQMLIDAGVFVPMPRCRDNARLVDICIRLAPQNKSAAAFRVVLAFLRAGARLPTTNDRKLTTEMVATLKRDLAIINFRTESIVHSPFALSAENARRSLDSGMREFLELVITEIPGQNIDTEALGLLLNVAAAAGDQALVDLLLRYTACVNSTATALYKDAALGFASRFGHLGVMKSLLDAGVRAKSDKTGNDALTNAVKGGYVEAVKIVVDRGATLQPSVWCDMSFQEPAVKHNHLETLPPLAAMEREVRCAAFAAACAHGQADIVACLLAAEATEEASPGVLKSHAYPLYLACLNGHADVARRLIEHGADVNQAVYADTPLIAAASSAHVDIVQLLLDSGAEPNQLDGYWAWAACESLVNMSFVILGSPPGNPEGLQSSGRPAPVSRAVISGPLDPATGAATLPNAIASTCESEWSLIKHAILELLLETASSQSIWDSAWRGGLWQAAIAHNHTAFALIMEYIPPTQETLCLASVCGSLPAITLHLDHGIRPPTSTTTTTTSQLPLHAAAYHLHPAAVSHLLTHGGADVNQLDGYSASHPIMTTPYDSKFLNTRIASLPPDAYYEFTPLLAALWGFYALLDDSHLSQEYQADMGITEFEEIVRCLLEHGARTDMGSTPLGQALDVAKEIGHKGVEQLLERQALREAGLDGFEQTVEEVLQGDWGGGGKGVVGGVEVVMGREVGWDLGDGEGGEGDGWWL